MSRWNTNPQIGMSFSSGILRVTIRPSQRWFIVFVGVAVPFLILAVFLPRWHEFPLFARAGVIVALIADLGLLIFKLSGIEIIEFSQRVLAVTKEIRGWERRREYLVEVCREMQWDEGSEDEPRGIKCKAENQWIRFAAEVSENQANEIFVEVQKELPDVAAFLFSFPEERSRFLRLGL